MANTLTYAASTLVLPDDLQWTDEFAWQAVEQRVEYSLTGALLVDNAVKLAGQTVTLEGGDNFAWISRASLLSLRTWAAVPGAVLSLAYRGAAAFDVIFDHQAGAISAAPIIDYSDPGADDVYSVTLRFLKV